MQIKTILGTSIQEALAEARALLGDDVVLLESVPAEAGQPARITVMVDAAPAHEPAFAGFGYAAARAARPSVAAASSASAGPSDDRLEALFGAPAALPVAPAGAPSAAGPLFRPPATPPAAAPSAPPAADVARQVEERLAARFEALAARLDAMERRLSTDAAGAPAEWAAHPLVGALRRSGLGAATTSALFRGVAERGLRPDGDAETIRWALAGLLRDRLAPTAPPRYAAQTLAVVGAPGAGKTSLLLKLAADARYFGHRRLAVLAVAPDHDVPVADPAPLFQRYGLPVRTVATPEEVREAIERTREFDGLLVDTPALPADAEAARRALERLRGLLAPLAPVEVTLVLDASRAAPPFDARALAALPLAPTSVALTHLDAQEGWGRAAEWALDLGLPVPFAVTGPERTGTLAPYSPAWLAETLAGQWDAAPC